MSEALTARLKRDIVEALGLEDVRPEDIGDETPLFGPEGLGLDSIDALELVVLLEKRHGIKLRDMETSKAAFRSVATLAEFIERGGPAEADGGAGAGA
ncbi:MAG: acyl carrier protein [Planctomycetota bacterium]|nr:MAG: acyl carrier protein [Planctomycetota bacterium]